MFRDSSELEKISTSTSGQQVIIAFQSMEISAKYHTYAHGTTSSSKRNSSPILHTLIGPPGFFLTGSRFICRRTLIKAPIVRAELPSTFRLFPVTWMHVCHDQGAISPSDHLAAPPMSYFPILLHWRSVIS